MKILKSLAFGALVAGSVRGQNIDVISTGTEENDAVEIRAYNTNTHTSKLFMPKHTQVTGTPSATNPVCQIVLQP